MSLVHKSKQYLFKAALRQVLDALVGDFLYKDVGR